MWGKASLHTGDEIIFNGAPIDSLPDFRRALRSVKLGGAVAVDFIRGGTSMRVRRVVRVTRYDRARVRIVDDTTVTPAHLARRRLWLSATHLLPLLCRPSRTHSKFTQRKARLHGRFASEGGPQHDL